MNALLFFSYEYTTAALHRRAGPSEGEDELTIGQVYAAGAASGFASAFITAPTELVKCLAQVNLQSEGKIREEWAIFRNMIRDHGWLGAHGPSRGLLMTIIRETPSFGLYFSVYEASTRHFGKGQLTSFVAGGCAGALAWASIYPLDVVKTRWQTAPPGRYASLAHCARSTVGDGWRTLFRGFGATMARAWPQNGVIFCTYELVKGMLTS
uniref:Mitochondrial carrier protein n=1 Tax=Zooxanthella nutricula TaxID=1333877 RepID=A0A7S2NRN5_9DINO